MRDCHYRGGRLVQLLDSRNSGCLTLHCTDDNTTLQLRLNLFSGIEEAPRQVPPTYSTQVVEFYPPDTSR